jgi:hypothetical protein
METGYFPSAYAPPIAYYSKLIPMDKCCIELFETFPKQTIRNRCLIAGANGVLRLTVPLHQRKNNTLVKDIEISYLTNWQLQHWRSIEASYSSSPFFEFYKDDLLVLYNQKFQFLWQWNEAVFDMINKLIKLPVSYVYTDEYMRANTVANDYRNEPFITLDNNIKKYHQVFEEKNGFIPNLSIFDLLFNNGNRSLDYL